MESFSLSRQSRPLSRSLSPSLPLLPDDVSLVSLFSSSHQPQTALSCPPHRSSLPTHLHLPSFLEPLHQCHPPLYFAGQPPSAPHTHTHTHTHGDTCMSTHVSFSYSHARPKIILFFLLQSLSLSLTHKMPISVSLCQCCGTPRLALGCLDSSITVERGVDVMSPPL